MTVLTYFDSSRLKSNSLCVNKSYTTHVTRAQSIENGTRFCLNETMERTRSAGGHNFELYEYNYKFSFRQSFVVNCLFKFLK